jgi:hypothetical protein
MRARVRASDESAHLRLRLSPLDSRCHRSTMRFILYTSSLLRLIFPKLLFAASVFALVPASAQSFHVWNRPAALGGSQSPVYSA